MTSMPYKVGYATPIRETTKALFCRIDDLGDEWIPKACIHADSEVWEADQEPGELVVTEWFAEKMGWE